MWTALVKQLAIDGVMQYSARQARKGTASLSLYILAGGIGVVGVAFLAVALYGVFLISFPMPAAAGMTGGVLLALSATVAVAGKYGFRKINQKREQEEAGRLSAMLGNGIDSLLADLEEPVRDNPATAVLLASLAGFLSAGRMH